VKVLHALGWYFPESVGGTEVYVAELARRQRDQGLEVAVAAPDAAVHDTRLIAADGIPVFRYPTATATADFAAYVHALRPDVVHVHSLVTGLGLPQIDAARHVTARVIFTAHLPALGFICQRGTLLRWGREACDGLHDVRRCTACVLEQRGLPQALTGAMTMAGQFVGAAAGLVPGRLGTGLRMPAIIAGNVDRQRQLFTLIDAFVVLNRRAQEIVLANGAPPEKVVLNRLASSFPVMPKPGPAIAPTPRPVRVGFVGRLHETKGLDVLVRAFLALDRDLAITLAIYGPMGADDARRMEAVLRSAAAADARITIEGAVDRAGVDAALHAIDVLCCPSLWFENGPTIALEAQAAGTPVIGSAIGALPEIVADGRNGRLMPPGDAAALTDVLRQIARDPSLIDRWRAALPAPRTMDDVAADYAGLYGTADVMAGHH
jgi:glycosyltransferase involved in cell wall biosynthesis